MSLRQLVEGDCGGVNPLMQLGAQFTRDAARKDEGFAQAQFERSMQQNDQMVNEFLGQIAAPPQSFQMETLLQEMREIEHTIHSQQAVQAGPRVIDEIQSNDWTKEFAFQQNQQPQHHPQLATPPVPNMVHMEPRQMQVMHVQEFFDQAMPSSSLAIPHMHQPYIPRPQPYLAICPPAPPGHVSLAEQFFSEAVQQEQPTELPAVTTEDWVKDYQSAKEDNEKSTLSYNEQFWNRLQEEWQKLSEDPEHPWLSEYAENYDPYNEYQFVEENPMSELENAFEKGKQYLAAGDIPSAVLCFEVAAKQDSTNYEVWQHLGNAQAINEMDPQAIAALKKSLDLNQTNGPVLMALAICYTNESLQSQALKMLTNWMRVNPKYAQLLDNHPELQSEAVGGTLASSLITGNRLSEVQELFLEAVRMNPAEVDADVQEALGILYNLSSEYDKAVDCFRAAVHVNPQNAKLWNRLGASLANGSRSVEAVEAYQRALELEPGFIRVRYNVGVCCMNLKAFKEAAEHLITALNMQSNSSVLRDLPEATASFNGGQQQMSDSIWHTLRMVISLMARSDLHKVVDERNLAALNEAFNID